MSTTKVEYVFFFFSMGLCFLQGSLPGQGTYTRLQSLSFFRSVRNSLLLSPLTSKYQEQRWPDITDDRTILSLPNLPHQHHLPTSPSVIITTITITINLNEVVLQPVSSNYQISFINKLTSEPHTHIHIHT
jgi:hypothetical protein